MKRRFDLAAFLLFRFVGGIIAFMLFWVLLDSFAVAFFDYGIQNGGTDVSQGAEWAKYGWTFGPALMLTMISMHLLSRAIFESRGGAT